MKLTMHLNGDTVLKGSSTSGNHGHAGIPGHRGGSRPKDGGTHETPQDVRNRTHPAKAAQEKLANAAHSTPADRRAAGMSEGSPTPKKEPLTIKSDHSLYKPDYSVDKGTYVPQQPIKVWVKTGSHESNAYYGAARLLEPEYTEAVITSKDKVLHWPGGLFLLKGGKGDRMEIKFEKPNWAPFEHSYGGNYNYIPVGAMKFLGRHG